MSAVAFTFDEAAHIYRDSASIVRPSVTQCLKAEGFINFDGIRPDVLERKRRLGSLVHEAAMYWDQGLDLDDFNIPDMVFDYLEGYKNFREDCAFTPQLVECRSLASLHGMVYGMCPDRVGLLKGEEHILELKCGASESAVWGLQLAAYDMGLPKAEGMIGGRRKRFALQLGPTFSRGYKQHPYDDHTDYIVWANTLANTVWKANHKIFVTEDIGERVPA